ncbi:cytoplasmic dynein 2 light intermediate chain 1-like isoform X2 [Panonychus citri]|uniref:cytoplasmic dynein 2 light intermediate chain 1-like isoform X2 n=1 Tax=Panonychus citri TaxID=50023 RepID=UPI002307DE9D|nr:cytoplasmic dynein 2 light intermediate chain 1-like isoform X2 [Panonychus citri]
MVSSRKTVWDLAVDLKSEFNLKETKQTLLFIGSKESGKSSIINRFMDRKDEPKPTLALNYLSTHSEKIGDGNQLCDIWELGDATYLLKLLPFVLKEDNIKSMAIVIVLDLSRPNELVSVTECLLQNICEIISPFIKKQSNERRSSISRNKAERMSSSNIKKLLPNLSIPIIIMANKYDLFQDMEPDDRRLIKLPEARFDNNNPIWMPSESDPSNFLDGDSLEILKNKMIKRWNQIAIELILPDDPAKDENFKERDVDLIRTQRYEELEKYRRQLDHKVIN